MSDSMFSRMPTELVEMMAEYLDDKDLTAFRLSCTKLDAQSLRIVGERLFVSIQTSLIGSDIQKFEQLACGRFAKYVKRILVQDDADKNKKRQGIPPVEQLHGDMGLSPRVWPCDELGNSKIDEIEFATLKNTLRTCKLRPDELTVGDYAYKTMNWCSAARPCATISWHFLLDSKLAVSSLRMETSLRTYRVEATLLPEHQGQDLGLALLKKAEVRLGCDGMSLCWTEQLLLHAPMLEDLFLSAPYERNPRLASLAPCFQLKRLHLDNTRMSAISILNILSSSKDTLVSLSFREVRLQPYTEASDWTHLLEKLANGYTKITHWEMELYLPVFPYLEGIVFPGFDQECLREEDRSGLNIVHNGRRCGAAVIGYNGPNAAHVLYTMAPHARSW